MRHRPPGSDGWHGPSEPGRASQWCARRSLTFRTIGPRIYFLSLLLALIIAGCGGDAAPTREWAKEDSVGSAPAGTGTPRPAQKPSTSDESPPPGEDSTELSEGPAEEPTAAEVATFLDREFKYSRAKANDRPEKVKIRVYASRQQLREEQQFLDRTLGALQPTAVTCGLIRVEIHAGKESSPELVEEDHARELKRAMSTQYDC